MIEPLPRGGLIALLDSWGASGPELPEIADPPPGDDDPFRDFDFRDFDRS